MSLPAGTRIGPYTVVSLLGSGGMGDVYRARDAKLNRDVALKTLPARVANDPSRLARFKREAQLLASLNHQNIAAIYGFEDSCETHALVLELVEGPTLADILAQGRPVAQALRIARQIADALEAAHERGVIHRDLKPANIKLRPDDTVKVLDFGLAKALDPKSDSGQPSDVTSSPTITSAAMTGAGVILGTAAYMSPEQARGATVDARTDIWAFGCVLFELLVGQRAFPGDTVPDAMASILSREPSWDQLPPGTPPPIRRLLRRCLAKDARQRLRDIADARFEIDEALNEPDSLKAVPTESKTTGVTPGGTGFSLSVMAAAAALAAVAGAGIAWSLNRPIAVPERRDGVTRVSITPNELLADDAESPVTISPDGRQIAYLVGRGGARRLFLRGLDQYDSRPVPGTEGADFPVFSPDGRWLAFVAAGKLKKVDLNGGAPFVLTDVTESGGVSWRQPDTIFFSAGRSRGIRSISASGGTPVQVSTLEATETYHRYPDTLADGSVLLFTDIAGNGGLQVFAQSLKDGKRQRIALGSNGRFLGNGLIAYGSGPTLNVVPFDVARLDVTGPPVPILDGVALSPFGAPQVSFADNGTPVYVASSGQLEDALVWVDSTGMESSASGPTEPVHFPRLSSNGQRVSAIAGYLATNAGDVQIYDLIRQTWNRFTADGNITFAIWPRTAAGLTVGSTSDGRYRLEARALDGRVLETMLKDSPATYPLSWSPDDRHLAIVMIGATTGQDVMVIDRNAPNQPKEFVVTQFREGAPAFSPDGRWIAYVADKSGRNEVYMRPFPGPGEELTLSTDGGNEPVWARNVPMLFYRQGDAMMAVDLTTTPPVSVGRPRKLFEGRHHRSAGFWPNYDVTPDGKRFLMVKGAGQPAPLHLNLVINWMDELKQRVASTR